MLGQHLQLIKHLDEAIGRVTEELARRFTPPEPASSSAEAAPLSWQEAVEIVEQVTGISTRVAQGRLSEIGVDMRQIPSANHLASWVGICPGHHESAGKRERRQDAQR
jgi:transposase